MLELVDANTKEAPSANDLQKMLEVAEDYVEKRDPMGAWRIDSCRGQQVPWQQSSFGVRKYINKPAHGREFYKLKVAMEGLWAGWTPAQKGEPMRQPMREVGYSMDGLKRLKDHYAHRDSNYLMNLFEAICEVNSGALGGKYKMHGEVVYLMWREEQAMLSEELFTALGQADTATGRGFCHADAGDTATTLYGKARFDWLVIQQHTLTVSCYPDNMAEETERWRQFKADLEWRAELPERIAQVNAVVVSVKENAEMLRKGTSMPKEYLDLQKERGLRLREKLQAARAHNETLRRMSALRSADASS